MYLHLTVYFTAALLAFLPGCGDAPSVLTPAGTNADAAKSSTIHWEQSAVSGWRYELESVDKVAVYWFKPQGHVVATIGGRDPDGRMAFEGPVFYWRIDADGNLLLSDEVNGPPHTELALLGFDNGTASVLNVRESKIERYSRKLID